jgi:chromosome segregation ATPase
MNEYRNNQKLHTDTEFNTISRLTKQNLSLEDNDFTKTKPKNNIIERSNSRNVNLLNRPHLNQTSKFSRTQKKSINYNENTADIKFNNSCLETKDYLINLQDKTYELNAHMEEFNQIKKINYSLESTIQSLETEIMKVKEDLSLANKRLQSFNNQETKTNSKINQMKQSYQAILQENSQLKLKLKEFEDEKVKIAEEINKTVIVESYASSKNFVFQKEIEQLELEIEQRNKESLLREEELKEKLIKIHSDYKKEISQIINHNKNEIENLTSQLEIKSQEVNRLSEEIIILNNKKNTFEERLNMEINTLKEDFEAKANRNNYLENKMNEIELEFKCLTVKYNNLNIENEKSLSQLKDDVETITLEKDKLLKTLLEINSQAELNNKIQNIYLSNSTKVDSPQKISIKMLNSSYSSNITSNQKTQNQSKSKLRQQSPVKNNLNSSITETHNLKINEKLINQLEAEIQKLKKVVDNQQKEINSISNQYFQDKQYYEAALNYSKNANEDKLEEIALLNKKLKKQSKEILIREDEITQLKNLLNDYKNNFQNEISNKNEEIYQLKVACDKMISKVYNNMERALYG